MNDWKGKPGADIKAYDLFLERANNPKMAL
jgi:hypothetical protein